MKCIILAGGFGTRLQSMSPEIPKPLIEVRGKPLISHIVANVPEDVQIIVSTNRKFEERFVAWQKSLPPGRQVELAVEAARTEAEKPGAVSALNMVVKAKKIAEDLLVIAGDNYFEFDLRHFTAAYDRQNPLIAVHDVGDIDKVKGFAEVTLAPVGSTKTTPAHPELVEGPHPELVEGPHPELVEGPHSGEPLALNLCEGSVEGEPVERVYRVTGCIEKPEHPTSTLVSIACYLFPPRIFPVLNGYCAGSRRDNLGSFIAHLVQNDLVYAYLFPEKWFDIGSAQAYMEAR